MFTPVRVAVVVGLSLGLWAPPAPAMAAPLVEPYLMEGKLDAGAAAMEQRLTQAPDDDEARVGLGVIRFLQVFEHLGASAHRYGLRTERTVLRPAREIREIFPQNPNPEALSYAAARQVLQTFVDDLGRVETTLAAVKNPQVKLPLHVALIKLDLFGQKKPVSAAYVFRTFGPQPAPSPLRGRPAITPEEMQRQAAELVVAFDRGDVSWLRGYCHVLAGWGELTLSIDGEHAFNCTAHLMFEKVETPYPFLVEDRRPFDEGMWWNSSLLADFVSLVHQVIRLPVKEPARVRKALEHFEQTVSLAKEMWTFILAESDDDHEWIPNPEQNSVVGVKVTQEMVDVWKETIDEARLILQGERLIPFWRGTLGKRGVNLRKVFTEPTTFDLIEWVQGPAAAPYLEEGRLTDFAEPRFGERLNAAFGGPTNFIGFGFWFN